MDITYNKVSFSLALIRHLISISNSKYSTNIVYKTYQRQQVTVVGVDATSSRSRMLCIIQPGVTVEVRYCSITVAKAIKRPLDPPPNPPHTALRREGPQLLQKYLPEDEETNPYTNPYIQNDYCLKTSHNVSPESYKTVCVKDLKK